MGSFVVLLTVMVSAFAMVFGPGGLKPGETGSAADTPVMESAADRSASGLVTSERAMVSEPAPSGSSTPRVLCYPNPTHDQVTFEAKGICWCVVGGLRVSIHDRSGALVKVLEAETPRFKANLESDFGLANGLYIARLEIRVDGVWTPVQTALLAIVR